MFQFKSLAARAAPLAARPAISTAAQFRLRSVPAAIRFYSNKLTAESPVTAYGANPTVKYTDNHEWVALHADNVAFVGITKYAADALGETTFAEVIEVPTETEAEESIGSVESVKSASDLYSPVAGTVVEANEEVVSNPGLVNEDPMGAGWFAKIQVKDPSQLDGLKTYEEYEKYLAEQDH